jgi:hypothetical protein
MAKEIGFSRAITSEWIKDTAEILKNNNYQYDKSYEELKKKISYKISSPTNIRKTASILMNLFIITFENQGKDLEETVNYILDNRNSKLPTYWCLMIRSYPVFNDIVSFIGKIFNMQDEFTLKWLLDRMYDEWGQRSTLKYSTEKILQTLVSMGILYRKKQGIYALNKLELNGDFNKKIIVETIMDNKNSYLSLDEINYAFSMFPFNMNIDHEWIYFQEKYELSQFGGKVVIMNKKTK